MRTRVSLGLGLAAARAGAAMLAALSLAAACGSGTDALESAGLEVEGPFTWGSVENVTRSGPLYFAGQPDAAALERAREAGVTAVINLRDPSEFDWDERSAVEGLGMSYHNLPARGVDPETFSEVEAIVKQAAGDGSVLIHCGSSNRVGAWYATHLLQRGHPLDDALEAGRKAGMRSEQLVEGVRSLAGGE